MWKIVVPARSTLDELVASVTARVQGDVYTRITSRLTPALIQAMDELLQVPLGGHRSMLFQLKEYPAEASYPVILRYIEHYHFLRDVGVGSIDLDGISPPMMRYLADQGKRYDVHTLRRFPEAKRYSLSACFLVEIHKTILDHIGAPGVNAWSPKPVPKPRIVQIAPAEPVSRRQNPARMATPAPANAQPGEAGGGAPGARADAPSPEAAQHPSKRGTITAHLLRHRNQRRDIVARMGARRHTIVDRGVWRARAPSKRRRTHAS